MEKRTQINEVTHMPIILYNNAIQAKQAFPSTLKMIAILMIQSSETHRRYTNYVAATTESPPKNESNHSHWEA